MNNKCKYILVILVLILIIWIWIIGKSMIMKKNKEGSQQHDTSSIQIIDKSTGKSINYITNLHSPITLQFNMTSDMEYISNYINISGCSIDFDWDWKVDYISKSWCNPSFTFAHKGKYTPKWNYIGIDKITGKNKEVEMKIPEITLVD